MIKTVLSDKSVAKKKKEEEVALTSFGYFCYIKNGKSPKLSSLTAVLPKMWSTIFLTVSQ